MSSYIFAYMLEVKFSIVLAISIVLKVVYTLLIDAELSKLLNIYF